jgi:ankyrin repeat protein
MTHLQRLRIFALIMVFLSIDRSALAHWEYMNRLINASGSDDLAQVRWLLELGADPGIESNGTTPLKQASGSGNVDIVKSLIQAGAGVNARSGSVGGSTALLYARPDVVPVLIAAGADVNARDGYSESTALISAATDGHIQAVRALLAAHADVNLKTKSGETALTAAQRHGYSEIADILLAARPDANGAAVSATPPGQRNPSGMNWELFNEVGSGDVSAVTQLISLGANVDFQGGAGSALAYASGTGRAEVVKVLLSAKASVNAKDDDGYTALMEASLQGHTEVVKVLLAAGADPNVRASYGDTALIQAAQHGHVDVVKLLLSSSADPNVTRDDLARSEHYERSLRSGGGTFRTYSYLTVDAERDSKVTAFMHAAQNGHFEIAQALIAAKADVNARSGKDTTALMMAAQNGHLEIVKALLAAHADIDAKNDDGASALFLASEVGNVDIVRTLLTAGADIDADTGHDSSPLTIAAKQGFPDVVELLLTGKRARLGFVDKMKSYLSSAKDESDEKYLKILSSALTQASNASVGDHADILPIIFAGKTRQSPMRASETSRINYPEIVGMLTSAGAKLAK